MPSTPLPYPQVVSRTFASFHVPKSRISASQRDFCGGSIPGSSTEKCPVQMVFSLPDWVLAGTPRKGTLRPHQQATLRREGEFSFESYFALIVDSPGLRELSAVEQRHQPVMAVTTAGCRVSSPAIATHGRASLAFETMFSDKTARRASSLRRVSSMCAHSAWYAVAHRGSFGACQEVHP
jgi:hypothetical protein